MRSDNGLAAAGTELMMRCSLPPTRAAQWRGFGSQTKKARHAAGLSENSGYGTPPVWVRGYLTGGATIVTSLATSGNVNLPPTAFVPLTRHSQV